MGYLRKIGLLFILVLSQNILRKCEPDWTYDFVCSGFQSETPDIVTGDFQVTRIARGIYGLTAFMDVKEDWTDRQRVSLTTYYSRTGSNFQKSPYNIPPISLSQAMNSFYKDYIQDVISDCDANIPLVNTIFIPPLKKNYFYMKNCTFGNDNWPSKMRSGYWTVFFNMTNQAVASVEIMVKVEPKD